jgi:phosphoadenosine phosphosulfate reductase
VTDIETLPASASRLNRTLSSASPADVIAAAVQSVAKGRLAVVSSFGTESAVLLKYVADVDPSLPVLFLDTGWLFDETHAYRDQLVRFFGLKDVRSLKPQIELIERRDPGRDLWLTDADSCCHVRKVRPLSDALGAFDGWVNGRKRFQGGARANITHVEADGRLLKFNPLAAFSKAALDEVFAASGAPRHPLEKMGFSSVGCVPCTSRTVDGEDPRAGRWRNSGRTECGIHQTGEPAGAGCGC